MSIKVFNRLQITAGKQIGTLYHLTNLDGIEFIMKDNKLKRGNYEGISFTRDKMLNFYTGNPVRLYFKLIIDEDKLSDKYKLEPFKYRARDKSIDFRNEAEEVVRVNEIPNINKYIKGVAFIYRNFEDWDETAFNKEGPDELLFRGDFKTFYNKDLPELLRRIDKKYGLYVQLGSQIKKDNKWFKNKGLL